MAGWTPWARAGSLAWSPGMSSPALSSLVEVFSRVRDFRDPRGKRHPLPALLSLVFLGLLARIREMAVLERWAEAHWDELKEPLGFTREQRPHATTISRALAACSLADFSQAFLVWVQHVLPTECRLAAAVDGKTSCQGLDPDGKPVHMLSVLVHDLKLVLGQWSVNDEKSNEPAVLRRHLAELFERFPLLQLITGDAMFAGRPLPGQLQSHSASRRLRPRVGFQAMWSARARMGSWGGPRARRATMAAVVSWVNHSATPGRRVQWRSSSHQRSLMKYRLFSICQCARTAANSSRAVTHSGSRLVRK